MITKVTYSPNSFRGETPNANTIKQGIKEIREAISIAKLSKNPFLDVPSKLENDIMMVNQDFIDQPKNFSAFI